MRLLQASAVRCVVLMGVLVAVAQGWAQQPDADDLRWQQSVSKYDTVREQLLRTVDRQDEHGPFRPNWQSLRHYQVPQWYRDAKFGIFIHWGVYSVPAFGNEWYPRNMYLQGSPEFRHEVATYGPQTKFGYKDFIPMFRAQHFDPHAWAVLFRESGAKYVIPVAEHHDGFAMYDSALTDWCAGKMGPKQDIIGELAQAIRAEGLHLGLSSHRAEHWWFFNGGRAFPSDVEDPRYASFYGPAHVGIDPSKNGTGHPDQAFLNDWLARAAEIVDRYHPELIYFDWWVEQKEFAPDLQRFAAFYYNQAQARGQQPVLFRKNDAFPDGTTVLDIERGGLGQIRAEPWQTDTSVSDKSWGYVRNDTYKSPESLVWQLVDIVSKNGNLLLNIGPEADGTIPPQAVNILRQMGAWLRINGEAIYGTRPWTIYGEGPTKVVTGSFHDTATSPYTPQDIRFTTKNGVLYAIAMGWPADRRLVIHSLAGDEVKTASLLGADGELRWEEQADGLHLILPKEHPEEYAYAFRILLKSKQKMHK